MNSRPAFLLLIAALALAGEARAPALADFRVCNKTHVLINLAIGSNTGDDFATQGWWTVTPGSCATPLHGKLKGRYVYLYATDIDAADVLRGTVSMCVDRGKFRVVGVADCWGGAASRRSISPKSTPSTRRPGRPSSPSRRK